VAASDALKNLFERHRVARAFSYPRFAATIAERATGAVLVMAQWCRAKDWEPSVWQSIGMFSSRLIPSLDKSAVLTDFSNYVRRATDKAMLWERLRFDRYFEDKEGTLCTSRAYAWHGLIQQLVTVYDAFSADPDVFARQREVLLPLFEEAAPMHGAAPGTSSPTPGDVESGGDPTMSTPLLSGEPRPVYTPPRAKT
jgi:hypothetical protein